MFFEEIILIIFIRIKVRKNKTFMKDMMKRFEHGNKSAKIDPEDMMEIFRR